MQECHVTRQDDLIVCIRGDKIFELSPPEKKGGRWYVRIYWLSHDRIWCGYIPDEPHNDLLKAAKSMATALEEYVEKTGEMPNLPSWTPLPAEPTVGPHVMVFVNSKHFPDSRMSEYVYRARGAAIKSRKRAKVFRRPQN